MPIVNVVSNSSVLCVGQSATLTASGAASYTWDSGSNTTEIAISPSITTSYTVNGTDSNGCANLATVTQNVSTCSGIQSLIFNSEFLISVYPNPSNGIYSIDLASASNITIADCLGKVVYITKLNDGKHGINLSNLDNGLYILKAESNGVTKTLRLIKE